MTSTESSAVTTGDPKPFLTERRIGHDEARESVQRLINSHFRQEPHARIGIPARPDYDDDLIAISYISQQRGASALTDDLIIILSELVEDVRKLQWGQRYPGRNHALMDKAEALLARVTGDAS